MAKQEIIKECEEDNSNLPFWADPIDCRNEPVLSEILKLNNSAKYYQYNIEIEFSPNSDFRLIGQLSKQHILKFGKADSLTLSVGTILLDPSQLFIAGMGSPNTFISDNAISISAQKLFPNMGLELSYTSMFDLDKKGALHGVGLEYEIFKNTNLLVGVTKIFNNDEIQMNPFTAMKDFSRILFEIRYFY